MVPWVLYITSHNSPPKYLEIKISILLVEEVKLTQADSNHLPHGQASKWWSDRNLVLLNEGGGGRFGSITRSSCHHLPSLTASSKLYPSSPYHAPYPHLCRRSFPHHQHGGRNREGIFSEVSVQRRTQPFPQGTSVSNISCLMSAKTAISEKGNTEEDAGLGSGHLQRNHIHPLQGNSDRMCCFMFQAASGQFPMNILTR